MVILLCFVCPYRWPKSIPVVLFRLKVLLRALLSTEANSGRRLTGPLAEIVEHQVEAALGYIAASKAMCPKRKTYDSGFIILSTWRIGLGAVPFRGGQSCHYPKFPT